MEFEIPKSQPKITKEFLLSKNSEETYMSTYLGCPIKKGLQKSALRNDHKPTASFYRNKKGELIYHDFGIGFHGNFIGVYMYMHNCDYVTALYRIAEDFHYIKAPEERPIVKIRKTETIIEEKQDTQIQIEAQSFSDSELRWWESFGVHLNTLKKFKVFSCKSVFLNGNYYKSSTSRSNIFGYYGGKKNGQELWRIYFPQTKEFRFLSNWSKSMIQGARQLPRTGDYVVITKSMKDVMCLYEQGIISCAPCSENTTISDEQLQRLVNQFTNVFIFFDNDNPGRAAACKYIHPNIKIIELKQEISKDISDCYKFNQKIFNDVITDLKTIITSSVESSEYFNFL